MSSTMIRRSSSITLDDPTECIHLMNPAWCATCRRAHASQNGPQVRTQLPQDGLSCSGCGALMHKGDTIVQDGRHRYCGHCS